MSLKDRIALSLGVAFSVIFGLVMLAIYVEFYKFRRDEFRRKLQESAAMTAKSIFALDAMNDAEDERKILDIQTEDRIYNEETLVFDSSKKLIYSNKKDRRLEWDQNFLNSIDRGGVVFAEDGDYENIGLRQQQNGRTLYIITKANDSSGRQKLKYLELLLVVFYLISTALVWFFSSFFVKKLLRPLDLFQEKITNTTVKNLHEQLPESGRGDEIDQLAKVYNTMLGRIESAYSSQKEFSANASHEIKTPLTRMAFQLENLAQSTAEPEARRYVEGIRREVFQLSETVNSLLLFSRLEQGAEDFAEVALDEVIFNAFSTVKRLYPDFEMAFEILGDIEDGLEIRGNAQLLEIVFINLLKNAALYSYLPKAAVEIEESAECFRVRVVSEGNPVPEGERAALFDSFRRGSNVGEKPGSGVGLLLVKRIIEAHGGAAGYSVEAGERNVFTLNFPKNA